MGIDTGILIRETLRDYELAQAHLSHFTRAAWPIVEPGKAIRWNWHHDMICQHLEAVVNHVTGREGPKISRLIINLPFGSTKTTIASIMFAPWIWTKNPEIRLIAVSHAERLATEASIASRSIIESPWYRAAWGGKVTFRRDQREKTRYQNTRRGYRMAFGMTAGGTGEHADILVFDDPHDAEQAMYSKAILEAGVNAYRTKWASRLNDPVRSAIIIIMQRLNISDLCGYLEKSDPGAWTRLIIPCRYEPERNLKSPLGMKDPRSKPGTLYWADTYDEKWYREQEINLGPIGVAGQLQQRPRPVEGGMVDIRWFGRYNTPPPREAFLEVIQFWDTASKGKELVNSPWVCLTAGRTGEGIFILDVHRDWHNYPEGKEIAKSMVNRWKPHAVVIEDKSTGQSLLQELPDEMPGTPCLPFEPEADKVTRLGVESSMIRSGRVHLPEAAPWLETFEAEIAAVPNASYMDQADALSMALHFFRTRQYGDAVVLDGNPTDWVE